MIHILLDECLPVKLKHRFAEANPNFQVSTVTDEKWTGAKDGNLLAKAQRRFDVFITIDKNLSYQQKISTFPITIILLEARSNRYKDLIEFVEPASEVIKSAKSGSLHKVFTPNP